MKIKPSIIINNIQNKDNIVKPFSSTREQSNQVTFSKEYAQASIANMVSINTSFCAKKMYKLIPLSEQETKIQQCLIDDNYSGLLEFDVKDLPSPLNQRRKEELESAFEVLESEELLDDLASNHMLKSISKAKPELADWDKSDRIFWGIFTLGFSELFTAGLKIPAGLNDYLVNNQKRNDVYNVMLDILQAKTSIIAKQKLDFRKVKENEVAKRKYKNNVEKKHALDNWQKNTELLLMEYDRLAKKAKIGPSMLESMHIYPFDYKFLDKESYMESMRQLQNENVLLSIRMSLMDKVYKSTFDFYEELRKIVEQDTKSNNIN